MVTALSTPDTVFNVALGLAMVIGWVTVIAIWWFVFRKAPRDGSETPYVVSSEERGDQPPRTEATPDSIASRRASIAPESADGR